MAVYEPQEEDLDVDVVSVFEKIVKYCLQLEFEFSRTAQDLSIHRILSGLGHLIGMHPRRISLEVFSVRVQLGGDAVVEPELAGEIIYPILPGNTSGSPRRSWRVFLGRRTSGIPSLGCSLYDLIPAKQKILNG